ncbi:MAG TPA: tetratricopeptide repeat protein [Candidatus Angelobacter sp.]|nr:tetratricopeptide repeat protein [Candidatus Angelobacter sp.]
MSRLPYSTALIFTLLLTCLCPPLFAQNNGANGDAMGVYSDIGHPRREDAEFDRNYSDSFPGQPACLHWPMNAIVTSVAKENGDKISKQARKEYDKGCAATRKKSTDEALKHLDLAVKADPAYAEAWVLLGQTQKEAGKLADAEQSCTQGSHADPNYLPAYLCLADIAAHQQKWDQVADFTNHVIDAHPAKAPSAFYYNSLANFHLNQFDAAEKTGLVATEQGNDALKAQVYLLLAKIDEAKGDRAAEADHLGMFLKLAPHDPNAAAVRRVLDEIKADQGAAAASK